MYETAHIQVRFFPVAQSVRLQCGRPGFDPWVRKIPCRRKWQSTPVLLPGKFHGWRSLVGYSPWDHKELDTTEQLHFHSQGQQKERNHKIGAEINEKETKETIAKINKTKSWFFEKINKIDKPLARLIKKKRRRIKSTKLETKMEKSQQTTQKYKGS